MSAFFAMGGYAAYVWPAYGVALVVLLGLGLAARAALKRQERELARLEGGRQEAGE